MRTLLITRQAAQPDVRTPRLRVKRPFTRARTRARPCHIELPRKLWDRIVLFAFTCCLFIFLHALFGLGLNEDLRTLNDTFVHPRTPLSISSPRNRHSVASNEDRKIRAPSVTRVMIDWHGNYEVLPSTASALVLPASIPQDAFPDPTPTLVRAEVAEWGRGVDEGSFYMTTGVRTPMDTPPTFYETPYDPFRLVFEDSVDGGEYHGPYPIAGPPRTARTRRFGGCLPGQVCL